MFQKSILKKCLFSPGYYKPDPNTEPIKVVDADVESQDHYQSTQLTPLYVKGVSEVENTAYREFLEYLEEKRKEARDLLEADGEGKLRAKKKEQRWRQGLRKKMRGNRC